MKDILIKLREKNRYTQTAMAKLVGVSRQAYMKYETGEVEPSIKVLRKLKEIYAVPYEVLIENNVAWLDSTPPYDLNNFNYQEDTTSGKERNRTGCSQEEGRAAGSKALDGHAAPQDQVSRGDRSRTEGKVPA